MKISEMITKIEKLYRLAFDRALRSKENLRLAIYDYKELISVIKENDKDLYSFIMSLDRKTRNELIQNVYKFHYDLYLTRFY